MPKYPGGQPRHLFHMTVDTVLRIDFIEKMYMTRHNSQLKDLQLVFYGDLTKQKTRADPLHRQSPCTLSKVITPSATTPTVFHDTPKNTPTNPYKRPTLNQENRV